jgi:putative transposase
MGSTYHSLHYHWVCSTKERSPLIRNWRSQFHQYLGGTIRGLGGFPRIVGGVEDHVHALLDLKTTHCIADVIQELKKASSIWAAANHEKGFAWQDGYAIFSVSVSMLPVVQTYIERQEEHHRKLGFSEELKQLLEKHAVKYDPIYLE